MNPMVKFTLGRVGLFVVIALALWPVPMDLLLKLMIAIIGSFGLQFVLLRKWRTEMIGQVDQLASQRRAEKEKLRAALAGDDEPSA